MLAIAFFGFLWYINGHKIALEYLSAYLMEWSLSIDNIFVFILIFTFFKVNELYFGRVLMIGILMAIILRILFITAGIILVAQFHWILYLFGALLIYTGVTMFSAAEVQDIKLEENKVYALMMRFLPLTTVDPKGRFMISVNNKKMFTSLFVVVILLAPTDIVFAVDSIPAVFGITQDRLVIYTSNIFAVLGLRSLFFLLQEAISKFDYLQQGIAIVLVFIGLKMLCEMLDVYLPIWLSLMVILVCISGAIFYSLFRSRGAGHLKSKNTDGKILD